MPIHKTWQGFSFVFVLSFLIGVSGWSQETSTNRKKQEGKSPIQVFLLAGQSNMEGQAVVDLDGKDYNEGRGTLVKLLQEPGKRNCSAICAMSTEASASGSIKRMMCNIGKRDGLNAQWGRDHWSTLFSTAISGGGIPGGKWLGRSDKEAAYAVDRRVSPEDLAATVYHALGIDPEMRVLNSENRPASIVENGSPLLELWS
ncbi:MAG: DUF1501 domain-containing protein [Pirellula sp.]